MTPFSAGFADELMKVAFTSSIQEAWKKAKADAAKKKKKGKSGPGATRQLGGGLKDVWLVAALRLLAREPSTSAGLQARALRLWLKASALLAVLRRRGWSLMLPRPG